MSSTSIIPHDRCHVPADLFWRGKPVQDMTREELIEALVECHAQFQRSAENFLELAKLNRQLLERHR